MTGSPTGSPVASAAAAVSSPSGSVGGTSSGNQARLDRRGEPLPVAGRGPRLALEVEREDSRPARRSNPRTGRSGGGSGTPTARGSGRSRRQVAGSLARSQFASQSAMKPDDRLAQPERPEGEPGRSADERQARRPALVEPDDRRAGAGRPSASVTTTVLRWVVSVSPTTASRRTAGSARTRRQAIAERPPVQLGILLGPARLGRDVRLDRDARGRHDGLPTGVEHERADALGPDVDREDPLGRGPRSADGRHRAHGVRPRAGRRAPSARRDRTSGPGRRSPPSRAGPSRPARYGAWSVPTPCWWLMVAAVLDDDPAGRRLEGAPALERRVRVVGEAEDVGRVQARAARIAVRQVAERVDALAGRLQPVAERPPELGGEVRRGASSRSRSRACRPRSPRPTARCAGTAPRTARAARPSRCRVPAMPVRPADQVVHGPGGRADHPGMAGQARRSTRHRSAPIPRRPR